MEKAASPGGKGVDSGVKRIWKQMFPPSVFSVSATEHNCSGSGDLVANSVSDILIAQAVRSNLGTALQFWGPDSPSCPGATRGRLTPQAGCVLVPGICPIWVVPLSRAAHTQPAGTGSLPLPPCRASLEDNLNSASQVSISLCPILLPPHLKSVVFESTSPRAPPTDKSPSRVCFPCYPDRDKWSYCSRYKYTNGERKWFVGSESFPVSWLFPSSGQSIGVSASALVLPMNIQDWFPSGLTGVISLQPKGLSRVFSSTTVRKHQFFHAQPSLWSISHMHTWLP